MTSLAHNRMMDTMDTMGSFDPMDMSYMDNPMPLGLVSHTDFLQPSSGLDMQDSLSNLDNEMYLRSGAVWIRG